MAWRYSWAARLSPSNALAYNASNRRWVRSGEPWISDTRLSHSFLKDGFFSHRLRVVGSTPSFWASWPWVRGLRSGCGVTSHSRYSSCFASRLLVVSSELFFILFVTSFPFLGNGGGIMGGTKQGGVMVHPPHMVA